MTGPGAGWRARRVGFVSTRFEGTDGVSLETEKWATVLQGMGHSCFYFAGICETGGERSRVVPEAFFLHPEIGLIHNDVFNNPKRSPETTRLVSRLKDKLKGDIRAFVADFGIEVMIVENALSIPLNIPLGLALTEFIAETGFPTIAHHHDFFWERDRFQVNCAMDYLQAAFPPNLPSVRHVVINSAAGTQLGWRTGLLSHLIPNVMDFDNPPPAPDAYAEDVREVLGVPADGFLLLQPTRVVQRKGIEHAIELADRLGPGARLIISHATGDEGNLYEQRVRAFAERLGVSVRFVARIIRGERGTAPDGRKVYALADVYQRADMVTYPSTWEGFGNAFLEAIYFRRPVVVNNYSIFALDIKPKGFRVIEFDGFITNDTVEQARRILGSTQLAAEMAERNYQLGRQHYSYTVLRRRLQALLTECLGEE
ncbi:MAG: glycosyltransferase family 4 protein [Verrucomicrobiae bacterium]|nr:glycosyltransferase family 4 protein [Verrucomicrobiae bacterium]